MVFRVRLILSTNKNEVATIRVKPHRRIIILYKFLRSPARFIFNGILLDTLKTFDFYSIEDRSTIIAFPCVDPYSSISRNKLDKFVAKADKIHKAIALREKIEWQQAKEICRIRDISFTQRERRNSNLITWMMSLETQQKDDTAEDEKSKEISIASCLMDTAMYPSSEPLPVCW